MFEKLRGALDTAITKATTRELNERNLKDAVWELQMVLIQNDVAVEVAEHICDLTKEKILGRRTGRLENITQVFKSAIHESILEVLTPEHPLDPVEFARIQKEKGDPTIILFVGVNGTGKTTTLAKLASIFKARLQGKK